MQHTPPAPNDHTVLRVIGARTHNLRGIDVTIPKGKIIAFTGVSGSGKSSLAIDTIHTEAQLRYLEGLEPYVRTFLAPRDRPQVDRIDGLGATLAVDQHLTNRNPNSSLGTVTGLQAYLGLLFSRLAPLGDSAGRFAGTALHVSQFDPNTVEGSCRVCAGRGESAHADPDLIVPYPDLPLLEGGSPWFASYSVEATALPSLAERHGTDLSLPWSELPESFRREALHGTGGEEIDIVVNSHNSKTGSEMTYRTRNVLDGGLAEAQRFYRSASTEATLARYDAFLRRTACATCDGTGLGEIGRGVTLAGATFSETLRFRIERLREWTDTVSDSLNSQQRAAGGVLVREFTVRLDLLKRLGLGHIQMERSAPSLSTGELQRARLAAQLGTSLSGIIYVLDEPGSSLHPAEKDNLFGILRDLRDAGNTVLLVEHDPEVIARADWVIDIGPGAGRAGGRLVVSGTPEDVRGFPGSRTGAFLAAPDYAAPRDRRPPDSETEWLKVSGIRANNVDQKSLRVPLNRLTCVTGVSGSGKSTLLSAGISGPVDAALHGRTTDHGVEGADGFKQVSVVDQSPIGRTPRSTPATYTKLFDHIRRIFAEEARSAGLDLRASAFSFNSPDGRCDSCRGYGRTRTDMDFLGDVWITCRECEGRRFTARVLEVRHRGMTIADVLELTVEEAAEHFTRPSSLYSTLSALRETGLGYLLLGQSAAALSGGEAQRLKLASVLARGGRSSATELVILDEPVTGLHPSDAEAMVTVLDSLVRRGHTVVIAEHDLHVAASADWIIDMGPGAGEEGGRVVNEGPPERVAAGAGATPEHLRRLVTPAPVDQC